jgi:carboxypeptidase Taq
VAPQDTAEGRGLTLSILAEEQYKLLVNDAVGQLLEDLDAEKDRLDAQTAREVHQLRREYNQIRRIPMEEYVAYTRLLNDAQSVWHTAKATNDFALFCPYLQQIVDYNRKFAGYYDPTKAPYDALLDQYEQGTTMEMLDRYFAQVRETVVPLLERVVAAPQVDSDFLHQTFPVETQRVLSDYLMEVMGIDRSHCAIGETEHPFTTNFNNKDVRITTHYYPDDFVSSMYSVIHEGGHALYELNTDDALAYTCLAGGVSMGIHESQSRFYENIIGRSEAFIGLILPKLQELFPQQLAGVTAQQLYKAVSRGEPGLIRTEADELTYSLHIMVRYEIEKQLIDGTLAAKDVPQVWNRLYKEYLGLDVPNDTLGCLQDSHWSGGSLGYFPSYSLGSAYGAQLLAVMNREMDFYGEVANGNLAVITAWLKEHIHRFGCLYDPGVLLEMACGEPFDPKYYTDYLTKKYSEIYDL